MRRYRLYLLALTLLLLSACGPAEPSPEPLDEEPIELESLSVEVSRGTLSTDELAQAARDLPEALKAALAEQGVEAETRGAWTWRSCRWRISAPWRTGPGRPGSS